jgi:hypothetical protein
MFPRHTVADISLNFNDSRQIAALGYESESAIAVPLLFTIKNILSTLNFASEKTITICVLFQ